MSNDQLPRGASASWSPQSTDYARLLDGVRTRRVLAFILDYTIVGLLWLAALVPVFILGIVTLGLGWFLYPILGVLIAVFYIGTTMSGQSQATWGMRFFSIRLERLDGARIDFVTAVVHAVLFWVIHGVFAPLLLVSLFTDKKQLLQDILLGTFVVRSDR